MKYPKCERQFIQFLTTVTRLFVAAGFHAALLILVFLAVSVVKRLLIVKKSLTQTRHSSGTAIILIA